MAWRRRFLSTNPRRAGPIPRRKIELPLSILPRAARPAAGTLNHASLVVIPNKSVIQPRNGRVPVTCGPRLLEFACPERVRQLAAAPNARIVRRHKDRAIVCVVLEQYGDDSRLHERNGDPQRLSHNHETPENPHRVWTFKKLQPASE